MKKRACLVIVLFALQVASAEEPYRTSSAAFKRSPEHALLVRKISRMLDTSLVEGILGDPRCVIDSSIITHMRRKRGTGDGYAYLFTDSSVTDGKRFLETHRALLDSLESTFGIPRTVLVAVYRAETDFGRYLGKHSALTALYTGYFMMKTERKRKEELLQLAVFLELARDGIVDTFGTPSSYRGAFGCTQFRPASYVLAVDWDRDGRANLFSEADALASAANYLKCRGYGAYNGNRYQSAVLRYARVIGDSANTAPKVFYPEPFTRSTFYAPP